MSMDFRPNLIIAGAQKAGTTTLASRLSAHPQIYMPPEKELNFFTKEEWFLDIDSYLQRFERGTNVAYRLDATPGYLWTDRNDKNFRSPWPERKPSLPGAIKSLSGVNTKIIIILRHPTFRAISAFFHQFRMGRVGTNDRIRNLVKRFGLVDIGFYSDHLRNYYNVFPKENIKILFLEKYASNKVHYDRDILTWLHLDPVQQEKIDKEDSNANFKVELNDGALRFKDGIEQVHHLKKNDQRYRKMLDVAPPIVEEEDVLFLNQVYNDELKKMRQQFPITKDIWSASPKLSEYLNK